MTNSNQYLNKYLIMENNNYMFGDMSYMISKVCLFTESSVTYLTFEGPGAIVHIPVERWKGRQNEHYNLDHLVFCFV